MSDPIPESQSDALAHCAAEHSHLARTQAGAEATQRSRELFRLVHTAGKIGHWEWNSDTDENLWSPEIEALYGLPPGGFEGGYDGWAKLLHPDDRARAAEDVRRALETGEYFTEFRVVWPDGSVHWLETRANVYRDASGKAARIIGVNMDVTERKRVEEELRESRRELAERNEQLAEASRKKDEFLAMLAHELRNPLAPIRTAMQVLGAQDTGNPVLARMYAIIERQVQNMAHILDDLLDVSRVTRGLAHLRIQPVDLRTLVMHALDSCRLALKDKECVVEADLGDKPLLVEADPLRLEQVVANLLINAGKYSEAGGAIRLTAFRENGEAVLSVQDNGRGIEPELLPHVFELFTQGDTALDRGQAGLGIGLTLVKGLVEGHGGSVEAKSRGAGYGAEFVVRLPLLNLEVDECPPSAPAVAAADKEAASPADLPRNRVLLVDDNRDGVDALAELLELSGFETLTAYDGATALQLAREHRPDAAILDIGMPGMTGYELARCMRSEVALESIRLLAVTGYGQSRDREQAREAGFDAHFTKPVDVEEILQTLTVLLSR